MNVEQLIDASDGAIRAVSREQITSVLKRCEEILGPWDTRSEILNNPGPLVRSPKRYNVWSTEAIKNDIRDIVRKIENDCITALAKMDKNQSV